MIIGYTCGVYDLLHIGHINLLQNAKTMCDKLIVGLSTDECIKYKLKNTIMKFKERKKILESIKYVDCVIPQNDTDYKPHTIYGQSKIITEQLTRSSDMNCIWTIVRPTTIWGPGDLIYRNQFYKILKKKLYFHPGNKPCYRSYGYVGNIVFQLLKILNTNPEEVNKKVIYLGDELINVLDWVNEFHMQLHYRKAYIIPSMFIKLSAIFGDLISKISGKRFFIDTSRYRSMIESYPVPIEPTNEILGKPPFTMKQGVEHTIVWLKQRDAL